ncbi:DUF4129 domain-containing transglutaminase family protein [Chloroflexota bacterium]
MGEWRLKEGWGTVALLVLMLLFVAWSIQAARWTAGLAILQAAVLVGGVFGIVVAKSRSPSRMVHLLAILAGLTWAFYLTSTVLGEAMSLNGPAAVMELERRVWVWSSALISGTTTSGNYVFLLLMTLLMWIVAYVAAWAIFRWQKVWWGIIICSIALMVNLTYAKVNLTLYLVAFLLLALLLVVRTNVASHEHEWQMARVSYSPDLVGSFLRAGMGISVVAILLAWVAPDVLASRPLKEFWDKAGEPWRQLQDESARIFHDLNYQNEPELISLSRSMTFSGPVNLADTPVMDVRASRGRYWRHSVYHAYTGDGWTNTDTEILRVEENATTLTLPDAGRRREVTQTMTLYQSLGPQDPLTAAGQPVRAGTPLRAAVSYVSKAEARGEAPGSSMTSAVPGDPSLLYPLQRLEAGESYLAVSALSDVDDVALRRASDRYPSWVAPRYLQLPEDLPERVVELAEEVTADQETPYDKAIALRDYLRSIPYSEDIVGPAPDRDGVDYFLFDERQGYCTYYASSMVVMLRAVGVPARYVEGYAQANRVEGIYHIRELDGHSWPEVFFPGYGWLEFEPTSSEVVNLRSRAEREAAAAAGSDRDAGGRSRDERFDEINDPGALGGALGPDEESLWQSTKRWGLPVIALGLLLAMVAGLRVSRRRRVAGLTVAERLYADLVDWARRLLRIAPLSHQTPNEYAHSVAWAVPRGQEAIETLADLYTQERFGGKEVSEDELESAWREVWPNLVRRWAMRRTKRLRCIWQRFAADGG